MGADDERSALDLVGEVSRPDAAIRKVRLDAGVVDELAEGGDLLALLASVLGLVDRQSHAIAEAGALGDAYVGAGGGCSAHLNTHSIGASLESDPGLGYGDANRPSCNGPAGPRGGARRLRA